MTIKVRRSMISRVGISVVCAVMLAFTSCSDTSDTPSEQSERLVSVGFYAFFDPISHSANPEPGTAGFDSHAGYEADLLSAVEAMDGLGLSFDRQPIARWEGIWLKPSTDSFDLVGGGITILESRTLDPTGKPVVAFTDSHIEFRQSLLVRATDATRLSNHDALGADDVVGALPNTTGEARLLQLIGVADTNGGLARGTQIETPEGVVTVPADGAFTINAANASPELAHRTRLIPADPNRPHVLFLGDDETTPVDDETTPVGEAALLSALREGRIDALARGMIGNAQAATASQQEFQVTALDDNIEIGGFVVDVDDTNLLNQMNTALAWLTDDGRIGFTDWLVDPNVFMTRATQWQTS